MSTSTDITEQKESQQSLAIVQDTSQIILDATAMQSLESFAVLMASGRSTVPKHLQGNKGDCMAVAMQATQWRMNPFTVAQKTHLVHGTLGYEAQLVSAVITTLAPIAHRPKYEFLGDWAKILGRVKELKGDNGKYYAADWLASDETGLGVKVSCTLKGEDEPRELMLMMTQCFPRFSTLWATDPQQQICYAAIKKWARRFTPDVILGVYTPDELQELPPKDINAAPARSRNGASVAAAAQSKGAVIDHGQEERRIGLITALEAHAKKGTFIFATQWKAVGKASRDDVYLVGEQEYARLLTMAENADIAMKSKEPQANTTTDSFLDEMEAEENK